MNYDHLNGVYCDYLEHYGVLGMKWGVRRYQNSDGTLTAAGKKRLHQSYKKGTHGDVMGQSRDSDIYIKKGTTAYRLQEGSELKPGQSYVSFDKLDHVKYIGATAGGELGLNYTMMYDEKGNIKSGSAKSITLHLTEDIIAPSYEKTMDTFIETMGKVKINDIFGSPKTGREKEEQRKFIKDLNKLTVEECRDRAYEKFAASLMQDTTARKKFFDSLKRQGYNAIIDENDKRFSRGFTNAPVILFDSSSLRKDNIIPLDKEDIEYFQTVFWSGESNLNQKKLKEKWEKYAGRKESEYFN